MSGGFLDRTNLTALNSNLAPSTVSSSQKMKDTINDVADQMDANWGDLLGQLAGLIETDKYVQLGVLNVKSFGAKGDRLTDDTDAIQSAIDAISPFTWKGSIVDTQIVFKDRVILYFPPGEYIVSDTILLNPGITYYGPGATIKAANFTNKAKFVAEAKVFKNDGTVASGWTYGSTNYDIHTFVSLDIIGIKFDGDGDGVYGGLSLTSWIYGILQDTDILGKYVGLRVERSFNDRLESIYAQAKYAGLAITSNTINKFSNCRFTGNGDCTSSGDITILDAADDWLFRSFQDATYKNYGRGLNISWCNSLEFETLTVEGCYSVASLWHCSLFIKTLYTESVGYGSWAATGIDALFFGASAKLSIESHVWTSAVTNYIFEGTASQIFMGRLNHTDNTDFIKTTNGVKVGTGVQLTYDSSQFSLSSNDAENTRDTHFETKTLTNNGGADTVTYTKYGSGELVINATGFYSIGVGPPYEKTWTFPVEFKDASSVTVFGCKNAIGSYKRGSTVTVMELDETQAILSFSGDDITYNVTAIGRWR